MELDSNQIIYQTWGRETEMELQRDSVVAGNATTADGRNRTVAKYATVQNNRKNNGTSRICGAFRKNCMIKC